MIEPRRIARDLGPLAFIGALACAASAGLGLLAPAPPHRAPRVLARAARAERPSRPVRDEPGVEVDIDDPSGHALDAFHAALRLAARGEGTARILVYGGSHAASDLYTGRMRELLQARFGDAGHGFAPLVPIILDQWAWGVRFDDAEGFEAVQVSRKHAGIDRYGLAGAVFLADEPGAFAAVSSSPWGSGREASRLTLLYDRRPGGGSIEVWIDGRSVEVLWSAAAIPSSGSAAYLVSDGPHRFEVRARGDGPIAVYGVLFERDRSGVLVENLGLVGAKARHQLAWSEEQWRELFVARRPDLVILAYGNNELDDRHLAFEAHEEHLRAVLRRVHAAAPRASCLLVGPTDRPVRGADGALAPEPAVAAFTAMQRRIAADEGCGFFDTVAFQGGTGAAIRWLEHDPPYVRPDLLHLTPDAYKRWGEVLTRAILAGYDE